MHTIHVLNFCCSPDRIIEPLASRCSKFRFKALDPSSTRARVEMIADAEHVQLDDGVRRVVTFDLLRS